MSVPTPNENTRRPNAIWVFDDQHRAQAMGCAGNAQVSTPNLDALAANGVYFTRAVAGCPWCTPFRGSLLTGLYPQHCVRETPQLMDPSIPTIAHAFGRAGYETAYFGKWHLAWDRSVPVPEIDGRPRHDAIPVPRELRGGFDTWIGYNNGHRIRKTHPRLQRSWQHRLERGVQPGRKRHRLRK